jgi:hypothetical protein
MRPPGRPSFFREDRCDRNLRYPPFENRKGWGNLHFFHDKGRFAQEGKTFLIENVVRCLFASE